MRQVLLSCLADCQKIFGLQGSAANQAAIDIRLADQILRIARIHAAPVKNAQPGGHIRVQRSNLAANEGTQYRGSVL